MKDGVEGGAERPSTAPCAGSGAGWIVNGEGKLALLRTHSSTLQSIGRQRLTRLHQQHCVAARNLAVANLHCAGSWHLESAVPRCLAASSGNSKRLLVPQNTHPPSAPLAHRICSGPFTAQQLRMLYLVCTLYGSFQPPTHRVFPNVGSTSVNYETCSTHDCSVSFTLTAKLRHELESYGVGVSKKLRLRSISAHAARSIMRQLFQGRHLPLGLFSSQRPNTPIHSDGLYGSVAINLRMHVREAERVCTCEGDPGLQGVRSTVQVHCPPSIDIDMHHPASRATVRRPGPSSPASPQFPKRA